jgi:tetratricopeptide (TPR) repeat protein
MDATNSLSSPMTLMRAARDKRALMIDRRGQGTVVRTPAAPPTPSRRAVTLAGTLEASGLLKGRVRFENRSDSEPDLRTAFASVRPEQHPELLKSVLARSWREARISSVKTADPADLSAPFWVEFEFERDVTGIESEKEWKLWIPDLGPTLLDASTDTTARKPVQFDIGEISFKASVDLPENITARAPLSISLERPFVSLTSNYSVSGRTLRTERVFKFPVPSISRDQLPAYEAARKAANTDREQDFVVGPVKGTAGTAVSLQKEGKAARTRKEYAKAVELLEKAAAVDPKLPEVYSDLGLALRDAGKDAEAIAAFTRAIEANPFHESAYADRADSLFELGRNDEAEKDLLKQIEVAPFEEWSYGRLADLRAGQGRHTEAAELYSKALTIDPKDADHWLDLAWEYLDLHKKAEAKTALDKAIALGLKTGRRVSAALAYSDLGEIKTAGDLASSDLADLGKRLVTTTVGSMSVDDLPWHRRLPEAWRLIGEAALEASDLTKAERYLTAAWEGALLPGAAHALGKGARREPRPRGRAVGGRGDARRLGSARGPRATSRRPEEEGLWRRRCSGNGSHSFRQGAGDGGDDLQ